MDNVCTKCMFKEKCTAEDKPTILTCGSFIKNPPNSVVRLLDKTCASCTKNNSIYTCAKIHDYEGCDLHSLL